MPMPLVKGTVQYNHVIHAVPINGHLIAVRESTKADKFVGLVITVSVLVVVGVAVYESPQFKRWIEQRKRRRAAYQQPQDISMTEDLSEAAEERRRRAREEILQRRTLLEARRRTQSSSSSGTGPARSFDSLVDKEGRLWAGLEVTETSAHSTGLETQAHDAAQSVQRRQPARDDGHEGTTGEGLTERRLREQQGELLNRMGRGGQPLHIALPSDSSHHPSESLVDLTPTSEFPDTDPLAASTHSIRSAATSGEGYHRVSAVATPDSERRSLANGSDAAEHADVRSNPFDDNESIHTPASVTGSLSHISREMEQASEGTLSDWDRPSAGALTPTSWSEVGSAVSNEDWHGQGHHQ